MNDRGYNLEQHVPRMYRVALRMLGDPERAQDAVQEACVKALAKAGSFEGRSAPGTWLHRITVNCANDVLRARRHDAPTGDGRQWEMLALLAGIQASPADAAESRELQEIAKALVDLLPDDCRTAFILTQLDGYSYDEAAAIEGKPRGTMASRVYRAKKVLLEQMQARTDGRKGS